MYPDNLSSTSMAITCFGEILWDIFPENRKAGGAPFNVAYHLQKMGFDSAMISRVGNDALGKELMIKLNQWHVNTQYIHSDSQYDTGTVIANIDDKNEVKYDIIAPVAWDYIEYSEQLAKRVSESVALVYGSLGERNIISKNTLLQLLPYANYKVFDINLRPPFVDFDWIVQLMQNSDLVKMNVSEMHQLLHAMGKSIANIAEDGNFIRNHFDLDGLILTNGSEGAYYFEDTMIYKSDVLKVKIGDTVGSGDSFLAGFLAGKFLHLNPENQPLYNASILAAYVTSQIGGTPDYDRQILEEFKRKNNASNMHNITF